MRGHYANIAERAVGLTATVRVRGGNGRLAVDARAPGVRAGFPKILSANDCKAKYTGF